MSYDREAAEQCIIEVGHKAGARAVWRDRNAPHVVVCDRHRRQYDERPDLGPFEWAYVEQQGTGE